MKSARRFWISTPTTDVYYSFHALGMHSMFNICNVPSRIAQFNRHSLLVVRTCQNWGLTIITHLLRYVFRYAFGNRRCYCRILDLRVPSVPIYRWDCLYCLDNIWIGVCAFSLRSVVKHLWMRTDAFDVIRFTICDIIIPSTSPCCHTYGGGVIFVYAGWFMMILSCFFTYVR